MRRFTETSPGNFQKVREEKGADEDYFWIGSREGNKRNREEKTKLKERNGSKKEEKRNPAKPMLNFRRSPCSISGGFRCAAAVGAAECDKIY